VTYRNHTLLRSLLLLLLLLLLLQVFVWHYAEANLVEQSMKQGPAWVSMVNSVIGAVRPVIDYVSISVGGDSLREVNPAPALHKVSW
jgi:hypothetical protein